MIKSVCGYCGVGCGIEFDETRLIGTLSHPCNSGLICKKGESELETIRTSTRLYHPKLRGDTSLTFTDVSFDKALHEIARNIRQTTPERVAFYVSGQMLTEDYYVANKLAKGFIKTANIDSNSRTCMASAVVAHQKVFGVDYVPVTMEDIDTTDLLILIGANVAEAHIVLFNRIKKAKKRGMKLIVIDPRYTPTAELADLYLPIQAGGDIDFLNLVAKRMIDEKEYDEPFLAENVEGFESFKSKLSRTPTLKALKRAGLTHHEFDMFWALWKESPRIISAWTMGLNQSVQGVDNNLAIINLHLLSGKINKVGCGPFSLTGQPNAMGGREVGAFATQLAVHLGFEEESIKHVENFWKTQGIPRKSGLCATEIMDYALEGKIDVLIICHTDPIYHLPHRHKTEEALSRIPLVVEINAYNSSETLKYAHILLPATPWGEKEGVQTNLDRTLSFQSRLSIPQGEAKPDWEIFALLGQALGFHEAFSFRHSQEVFEEFCAMTHLSPQHHLNLSHLSYESLKTTPFRWGEELSKHFLTSQHKAKLFFVQSYHLSEQPSTEYPFTLLTGRTRDQWHSGTKTGFVDSLLSHQPLSFVEIHPSDARKYKIESGDLVLVQSRRGSLITTALVTPKIRQKAIFIPVSERQINYLTPDILDKDSKEPDYNHTAVKLVKIRR